VCPIGDGRIYTDNWSHFALLENGKRAYTVVMTSTKNITFIIWGALLFMPMAIAAARGGPYGIASWALAILLIGWHPTGWILLTMLAITWRQRDPEPESFAWVPVLVTMG
jgi:hypothetical protein